MYSLQFNAFQRQLNAEIENMFTAVSNFIVAYIAFVAAVSL